MHARLEQLGLSLPDLASAQANYLPSVKAGPFLFVSGQLSQWNGEKRFVGQLGAEFTVAEGQAAARLCALNLLAQLNAYLAGESSTLVRCVRVTGYVNATSAFQEHHLVLNGASDLLVDVLGEAGRHTRIAVGVSSLPFGVAMEAEALFEVR
jgi:enamine deaminase RidA (YjgF/YER057c/UK114 family)